MFALSQSESGTGKSQSEDQEHRSGVRDLRHGRGSQDGGVRLQVQCLAFVLVLAPCVHLVLWQVQTQELHV